MCEYALRPGVTAGSWQDSVAFSPPLIRLEGQKSVFKSVKCSARAEAHQGSASDMLIRLFHPTLGLLLNWQEHGSKKER